MQDLSDLSDLLTSDTGMDNVNLIVKVMTQKFNVWDWKRLVGMTADRAGQNMGKYSGCLELVCALCTC